MSKVGGIDFERLKTSIEWSQRQLAIPRENRLKAIKQYVGAHYTDGGTERGVPTNFLELAVTIYIMQLAARAPRVMVGTSVPDLKPYAFSMEIALNQIPDEIKLGDTLRRAVVDALFAFAVVKVGIASSGISILGHDIGEPFVDLVSLDDYFVDMTAKSKADIQYEGNDYWLPMDDAREIFGSAMSEMEPDEPSNTGEHGGERADGISRDEGAELYAEKIQLRDVWMPRSHKLVTYAIKKGKKLRIIDWDGPEGGPYKTLGFSDVPDNLLPLAPIALWFDLHELANIVFRKLGKQANAAKTVHALPGGNPDSVAALKNAPDGGAILYTGPKPEPIKTTGVDQPLLAFWLQLRDNFSYFAGNLDSMGGLAPMTETVGQDKLLSEAANARVNFMRSSTAAFAQEIFETLAWYEWTDPVRERTIEKPIQGTSIVVQSRWSAETREGNWLDYNFDIDVYSMQASTPEIKLQKLSMALQQLILPVLPFFQQMEGGPEALHAYISLIAHLGNLPELNDVFGKLGMPLPSQPEQGNPNPSKMPANTTREYIRTNRPAGTRQGKDKVMGQALLGQLAQPDELAAIGRPVG